MVPFLLRRVNSGQLHSDETNLSRPIRFWSSVLSLLPLARYLTGTDTSNWQSVSSSLSLRALVRETHPITPDFARSPMKSQVLYYTFWLLWLLKVFLRMFPSPILSLVLIPLGLLHSEPKFPPEVDEYFCVIYAQRLIDSQFMYPPWLLAVLWDTLLASLWNTQFSKLATSVLGLGGLMLDAVNFRTPLYSLRAQLVELHQPV